VVRTFAPVGARFLASAEIKKSLAKTDFSLAGDSSEQVIFRMIFLEQVSLGGAARGVSAGPSF
jgi:hypothetical protein